MTFPSLHRWLLAHAAALVVVVGAVAGDAPPAGAAAPLLNFRLPLANEQGFRIWDLSSATLRVLDNDTGHPDRFELTTVHLRMFSGDATEELAFELFTPLAIVDIRARTVAGPGQLHVIGRGAELFGDDWFCDANAKSIEIKRNVVVSFSGDLGNFLQ